MSDTGVSADRAWFAAVSGLTVLTWYALPDAVRSRGARVALKTGLLGVTAAGAAMIPRVYPSLTPPPDAPPAPLVDLPKPALGVIGTAAVAASLGATVWAERAIFAGGERRRAAGVRCAHTRLAAGFAVITAAVSLLDWPKVVTTNN